MAEVDELLEGLRGTKVASLPVAPNDPTTVLETVDLDHEAASPGPGAVLISAVTAKNFFRHPDIHPIALDVALFRKYGPEWFEWEPETLEIRIPHDFNNQTVSELNLAKIHALKTLHMVDTFWQRWEVFVWCLMPFNSEPPDFWTMQVPTVAQCLVAVDIANRIRADVDWSLEVKTFLETVFRHDGIFYAIAPLDFVKIDAEGFVVDPKEIEARWPSVRVSGKAPTEETVTAEQLRRLLVVHDFLEESRSRLRAQIGLVQYVG